MRRNLQPGSSGCVSIFFLDLPFDYQLLTAAGLGLAPWVRAAPVWGTYLRWELGIGCLAIRVEPILRRIWYISWRTKTSYESFIHGSHEAP
jgi:hypothetical protein